MSHNNVSRVMTVVILTIEEVALLFIVGGGWGLVFFQIYTSIHHLDICTRSCLWSVFMVAKTIKTGHEHTDRLMQRWYNCCSDFKIWFSIFFGISVLLPVCPPSHSTSLPPISLKYYRSSYRNETTYTYVAKIMHLSLILSFIFSGMSSNIEHSR